jgi:hypothetical protein
MSAIAIFQQLGNQALALALESANTYELRDRDIQDNALLHAQARLACLLKSEL